MRKLTSFGILLTKQEMRKVTGGKLDFYTCGANYSNGKCTCDTCQSSTGEVIACGQPCLSGATEQQCMDSVGNN